jgi:nucleoside-diphosphate-sugar epimerase
VGTVLVTGADGQLGSRLLRRLLAAGYRVRGTVLPAALDPRATAAGGGVRGRVARARRWVRRAGDARRPRPWSIPLPPAGPRLELMTGDLRDPAFAAQAVDGVEAVVHTANFARGDAFENNVRATLNVVKPCAEHAARIQRLVYVSSSSVYPNDPHVLACHYHPVDERHPLRPMNAYAESKLVGEKLVWAFAGESGLAASVVRPAWMVSGDAVLGAWSVNTVCSVLRQGAAHPRSELYTGAGDSWTALRSRARSGDEPCAITDREGQPWTCQLVDARDVAAGIVGVLESAAAVGETFNLSGPRPVPFPEAAGRIGALTGAAVVEYQAPARWMYDLDSRKARTMTGYAPAWGIGEMLADALAFRRGETDGLT